MNNSKKNFKKAVEIAFEYAKLDGLNVLSVEYWNSGEDFVEYWVEFDYDNDTIVTVKKEKK